MQVSGQLYAPVALSPRKETGIHWMGGWVEPRAGANAMERIEISSLPGIELLFLDCHTQRDTD
jgi:hypothetical protein